MPGINSRHWDTILEALEAGPIEDPSGLATQKLQAVTGHESTNALAKILRRMEMEGLIERDISGRRTMRIALTAKGRRQVRVAGAQEIPQPAQDGIDYDLLAAALLAKALKATQAQELAAGAKDAVARAERAEAARRIAEADALAARARVAELEATVRQIEKNMAAVQAQMDKPQRRSGVPVKDRIAPEMQRELEALMRALPSRR